MTRIFIMHRALLLDLDDTLLHNSMNDFLPRYFRQLTVHMKDYMEPEPFMRALHHATQQMMENTDPNHTNETIFWGAFEPLLPDSRENMEPLFDRFYRDIFPTLTDSTLPIEGASELVVAAQEAGWKVAIATNPVFPRVAIEQRIEWAGLNPDRFDFVTSYENMFSTKPHPQYFAQIATALHREPTDCVMAGNHLSNDLVGAAALGMKTYWVRPYTIADADFVPDGEGTLTDLRAWLFE